MGLDLDEVASLSVGSRTAELDLKVKLLCVRQLSSWAIGSSEGNLVEELQMLYICPEQGKQ